jgi:hypothetical protein
LPLAGGQLPQIFPQAKAPGEASVWQIEPFELPDDLRLEDSRLYRLVFVDAQGLVIRNQTPYLPALRFFIGPPDRSMSRAAAQEAELLRHIENPIERSRRARELLDLSVVRRQQKAAAAAHRQARLVNEDAKQANETAKQASETIKQQAAALAEQKQREAEAAAYNREKWLVPLLSVAIPVAGALGIWLGPSIQEQLKSLVERVQQPALTEQEESARLQEWTALLKALPPQVLARTLGAPAQPPRDDGTKPSDGTTGAVSSPAPSMPVSAPAGVKLVPEMPSTPEHRIEAIQQPEPAALPSGSLAPVPSLSAESRTIAPPDPSSPPSHTKEPQAAASAAVKPNGSSPAACSSCIPDCSPPLSPEELKLLCDIVLDAEKAALLIRKIWCLRAQRDGTTLPNEPVLQLSRDEGEQIRRLAKDERLLQAGAQLYVAFGDLCAVDINRLFDLPPPFPSLQPERAQKAWQFISPANRQVYAGALWKRWLVLHQGKPAPALPSTDLLPKEQQQIRKFLCDMRILFWVKHRASSPPI